MVESDEESLHPESEMESDSERTNEEDADGEEDEPSEPNCERFPVIRIMLGQEFNNMQDLKKKLFWYSLSSKKDLNFNKCERDRLTAVCSYDGCPWRMHASIHSGTRKLTIKVLKNDHRCVNTERNKLFKVPRIVEMFIEAVRENPGLRPTDIRASILSEYSVRVTLPQCQIAKSRCLSILKNDHIKQFERLWDYVAEVRRSNPGSTVELETEGNVFKRIYVMLGALKEGWRWCRAVIHLDGAFLKWQMKGEVLSAVCRDANDQLFPIAWAIVDVENTKNWSWFIELLTEDLNLGQGEGLSMISDQQKGIIKSISKYLPFAEHRMCARHIWANLKKTCNDDEVKRFFWGASKSYTETQFKWYMEKLKSVSVEAYNALDKHNAKHWSRAYFSTFTKCDCVENNFSESFNSVILEARRKPVVQMLEAIRQSVMIGNARKIHTLEVHTGMLSPRAEVLIEAQKVVARACKVFDNGRRSFEVSYKGTTFVVSIQREYSCSCRYYDLSGIPCGHIIAALWAYTRSTIPAETICAMCWTSERWRQTYSSVLQPVNGMKLWARTTEICVQPPPNKIMPGRPKKKDRKKEAYEPATKKGAMTSHGRTMTCHHCWCEGHNARGCPKKNEPPVPPKEKGVRGRPRKHPKENEAGTSHGGRKKQLKLRDEEMLTQESLQMTQRSQHCNVRQEGFGIFQNSVTGDTYYSIGTSAIDSRGNTIFSTTLQAERDRLLKRLQNDNLDI